MELSSALSPLSGELASLIPHAARSILIVDRGDSALAGTLSQRASASVVVVAPDAVGEVAAPLDAIVINAELFRGNAIVSTLQSLKSIMADRGYLIWIQAGPSGAGDAAAAEEAAKWIGDAGLIPYLVRELEMQGQNGQATAGACGFVITAVRPEYNPLTHARDLFAQGYAARSFEILNLIPDALLQNPTVRAQVAAERMLCLLSWDRTADPSGRLRRFFQSQVHFFEAISCAPDLHLPYICQSEFWRRIGDPGAACRVLKLIQSRVPIDEVNQRIEVLAQAEVSLPYEPDPPVWRPTVPHLPRLLFILPQRPHYGLDILFDGLCAVLGDQNVTDFPWKPTLHGEAPVELADYPCCFNRSGAPISEQEVVRLLQDGAFDAVLFGDLDRSLPRGLAQRVCQAACGVPLFIVDQQDDPMDNFRETLDFLGVASAQGYFKREKLLCHDYGPHTVSLPFGYPESRIPESLPVSRTHPLFWAGHRIYGSRRPILEHVEALLGQDFNRRYSQIEYSEVIRNAQIGLNLCGYGFDTVRYWELPAHGCMLLSEHLPIHIPHPFEDGRHAVYFDDLEHLTDRLQYFLAHTDEARTIAEAGRVHLREHHTSSARASQMLGVIQNVFLRGETWPPRR
ncbi:MAG: glycosyltransferase [Candidatus Hydrogenedentes bacterium]|nr:glycosyltransferase [Candidatus Hydrogenedentota bacterium]